MGSANIYILINQGPGGAIKNELGLIYAILNIISLSHYNTEILGRVHLFGYSEYL